MPLPIVPAPTTPIVRIRITLASSCVIVILSEDQRPNAELRDYRSP
jgi:hypothetical protein